MNSLTLAPILRFVLEERSWPIPPRLEGMAVFLPAAPCAGIEFPLIDGDVTDLQQRIRSAQEVDRLKRLVRSRAACGAAPDGSSWQNLIHFCDAGLIGGKVDELWLELDDVGSSGPPRLSVFVRLSAALSLPEYNDTVERVLAVFGVDGSEARRKTLARCLEACPPAARVSHLGLMLGRPGAPIRLIVDGIAFDDCASFLERAGWRGSVVDAERRIDALFTYVDRVRLSLTVGDTLHPALEFECFVGRPGDKDPRWQSALDMLVEERLCSEQQRDRVLSWPAALTPSSVDGAWPASLLVNALVRSPKEIGWLDCRISHVKITHHDDRPPSAKAYLGFVEVWEDMSQDAPSPSRTAAPGRCANGLADAIEASLEFLLAARTQAAWWLDYDGFREGVSDEWVTAYVAHAIDETGDARAALAARRAWALLARRPRAGWGWNYLQPADADSTLWALRLASRLGALDSERARTAVIFLREHVQPGGGVATYLPDHHSAWLKGAQINTAWYDAHICVTAAAAGFGPLGEEPLNYLRKNQQPDGCWQGYWWKRPVYATAHAAEAFASRGISTDRDRVTRAVQWAGCLFDPTTASHVDPVDSPFDTALALRILLLSPGLHGHLIEEITQKLLAGQCGDGSWRSSAELAIPKMPGQECLAPDHRRTFTTATVLRTLHRLRMLGSLA
jgi:hypothetical protein